MSTQNGDYAILTEAYNKLTNEILEKNIVGEKIEHSSGGSNFDEGDLTTFANHQVHVDGKVYEMMDLIINLSNNTRLWSNNGYTPSELFETHEKQQLRPLPDVSRAKKIGRNDPCSCGSGKKYKKCCL